MFVIFSNLWKLLHIFRSLAAGYDGRLLGDVTAKAALNKLGIGVNMFGNQYPAHFDQLDKYDKFYDFWLMVELECHRTIKAGMSPNNQSTESSWRWDRHATSRGYQVSL